MTKASLQSARKRLQTFPRLVQSCSGEAAVYAKCVVQKHEDISPHACEKEFLLFKECLEKAARKLKTRI